MLSTICFFFSAAAFQAAAAESRTNCDFTASWVGVTGQPESVPGGTHSSNVTLPFDTQIVFTIVAEDAGAGDHCKEGNGGWFVEVRGYNQLNDSINYTEQMYFSNCGANLIGGSGTDGVMQIPWEINIEDVEAQNLLGTNTPLDITRIEFRVRENQSLQSDDTLCALNYLIDDEDLYRKHRQVAQCDYVQECQTRSGELGYQLCIGVAKYSSEYQTNVCEVTAGGDTGAELTRDERRCTACQPCGEICHPGCVGESSVPNYSEQCNDPDFQRSIADRSSCGNGICEAGESLTNLVQGTPITNSEGVILDYNVAVSVNRCRIDCGTEDVPYSLCGQVPDTDSEDDTDLHDLCLVCLDEGGFWTAFGCISLEPGQIVQALVRIGLGIAGGVALLMILIASFILSVSQGDPKRITQGREILTSAIIGLLFIIFSVTFLQFIGVSILRIPGFGG